MHYKNGREAKNGDKVVLIPDPKYGGTPRVGILYDATAGNDYCNGKLATMHPSDPMPNLKECLHLEDIEIREKKKPVDNRSAGFEDGTPPDYAQKLAH